MRTGVLDWAHAARPFPGHSECGDCHLVRPVEGGVLVAVIDGLGHGHQASRASRAAAAALESAAPDESLSDMMHGCHGALRGTRGATMSLARFDGRESTMTWVAVGNVEGRLARRTPGTSRRDESLLLRPGLLGEHLPELQELTLPMARGDVVVLATDGVAPQSAERIDTREAPRVTADDIMERGGRGTDDALVLVARFMG